jgi:hypothetical protein
MYAEFLVCNKTKWLFHKSIQIHENSEVQSLISWYMKIRSENVDGLVLVVVDLDGSNSGGVVVMIMTIMQCRKTTKVKFVVHINCAT